MQHSLDPKEILNNFYKTAWEHLEISGLHYDCHKKNVACHFGKEKGHKAHYNLNFENTNIGHLSCYRKTPFGEMELAKLEAILATLIPSLKNALLYKEAVASSLEDPLTGIGNRAAMESCIKRELSFSHRTGKPLSIVVADIDYFKKINDTYGHQMGDDILIRLAKVLQESLRECDQIFRFGGEEFVIVLSNTSHRDALFIADRMRQVVEKLTITCNEEESIHATVSLGVSSCLGNDSRKKLFERADKALYLAKARGRNCVVSSELSEEHQD